MIKGITSYSLTNKKSQNCVSNFSKNNNNVKNNSPSFTGGSPEMMSFLSYLVADVIGIVIGCGLVDKHFLNKGQKIAKDFGIRVIKKDFKKDFTNIEAATITIIKRLECDGKYKKVANEIKKSYEKCFQNPINTNSNHAEKTKRQTINNAIFELHSSVDNLFIKMGDKERFNAIGKPFLNTLEKAIKQTK